MNVNVFVTHSNNQDLSKANKFLRGDGKIIPFIVGRKNIFHLDTLKREIDQVFQEMQPNDYLLLAGNMVITSVVVAYVYEHFKNIKILLWDYNNLEYVEEKLNFNE